MSLSDKLKKVKDLVNKDEVIVPSGNEPPKEPIVHPPSPTTRDSLSSNGTSSNSVEDTEEVVVFEDKFEVAAKDQDNSMNGASNELGTSSLAALAEQVVNPPGLAEELFNVDKDIEAKTRLTPELVAQIAIAKQMALAYRVPMLDDFANNIMKLRISLLGEGRKEGVDMVKGQNLTAFTSDFAQRTKG